ncbi:hypothetical protein DFH09DRAFT_1431650 [Mycena vulgaris]|nr:hypothetical protein DFH09DRAFT_1431650 [Mycena vulgaris]
MSERRRNPLSKWVRGLLPDRAPSRASASAAHIFPQADPPSASDSSVADPKSAIPTIAAIDNLTVVLGLVKQVANVIQKAPFIAPAAALMAEILKAYKEVKDTDEKRDGLVSSITELTRDLCGTILRMEATNHVELIGRLRADIETYSVLLARASVFIKQYDNQGVVRHVAARNELGSQMSTLNRELNSFGARFRTNRLVDLAINQNVNTRTLEKVHDIALEGRLEKWLGSPDMKKKLLSTLQLRKEGTGRWLLESEKFIQWQDNPGSLWIRGPSGVGKTVLSSAVISELVADKLSFTDLTNFRSSPAIAFFYFDFKDKEGQAMDSALRRIILQLSAQSPNSYRILEERYISNSKGQTLPTYQELQKILEELLLELGRTYIVLDALDECQEADQRQLVEFVSTLQKWNQTPLHLLLTSQPRRIFTEWLASVPCIDIESDITEKDIRLFVDSELQMLESWASRAADRVVSKSNGMFRLAACLILEVSHCLWEDELYKTLDNLPNDLFGIYDRFLKGIRPEHLVHAKAVLRWLLCSREQLTLDQLADAIAFDFSDPAQFIYKPNRREGNRVRIPKWFEGLVTFTGRFVGLAHASVQDYLLSRQFTDKFGSDLSATLSHTFIAQTCITYLLYFSHHSLDNNTLPSYPLAVYAADYWCHHLLHCHDRTTLIGGTLRLLEDGSQQYAAFIRLWKINHHLPASPLHLCCQQGYIEGVRGLLADSDINLQSEIGNPLQVTSLYGGTEIVRLLLENGADVNAKGGVHGGALRVASRLGPIGTVHLLLEYGADVNAMEGGALQAAAECGQTEIVRLLLDHGAETNPRGSYGRALQFASWHGHPEIVCLLLQSGADVNAMDGTALEAASQHGRTEIVRLLLESDADVNANDGRALKAAACNYHTEIVDLLLEHGAIDTRVRVS